MPNESLKDKLEKVRKEIRLENEDLAFWTPEERNDLLNEIKEAEPRVHVEFVPRWVILTTGTPGDREAVQLNNSKEYVDFLVARSISRLFPTAI